LLVCANCLQLSLERLVEIEAHLVLHLVSDVLLLLVAQPDRAYPPPPLSHNDIESDEQLTEFMGWARPVRNAGLASCAGPLCVCFAAAASLAWFARRTP
jgi:hypothetical protein